MVFHRTLFSPHRFAFSPHISRTIQFICSNSQKSTCSHFRQYSFSSSAQPDIALDSLDITDQNGVDSRNGTRHKKSLLTVFREAVGLSDKSQESDAETVSGSELKKKLKDLETEIRKLKLESTTNKAGLAALSIGEGTKGDGQKTVQSSPLKCGEKLSSLFRSRKNSGEKKNVANSESLKKHEKILIKELSADMIIFASHLYKEGYFKDANFMSRKAFDISYFDDIYAREYIKFASQRYAQDNQEFAKWLSGSDLKKIALFGCPSLTKKDIFAAKRLRNFFEIQENTVCSKCILQESCKYPNERVWKDDAKNLNLTDVMKVVILHALEAVHPQLIVPDDVKASVSRILKEILNFKSTIA